MIEVDEITEAWAREQDARDPLASFRERFLLPDGIYFCGNSLGLQPRDVREHVLQELDDWAHLAVDAHFHGRTPWYSYHEAVRGPLARLVGAGEDEVVAMNGLTVNLHLMMASFYRPTPDRFRILVEDAAFPSDTYAVASQARLHGYDPADAVRVVAPRQGESLIRDDDILEVLEREGQGIALVLLGGVHYLTGQLFDMEAIVRAAHARGCAVGFDLAHAAGNVPLRLHDAGVDFAVWCSYKYLNAGPGAVAGCFVHARHGRAPSLPRMAGWWGNDPARRFRMHLEREFVPREGADGWQLSNPPILSLAPLRASLALFDQAGMDRLREKSVRLTGALERLVRGLRVEVLTPADPARRGCQLSIRVPARAGELVRQLEAHGVVTDFREPDVLRVAPVPLYNTFHEVWRFAQVLARHAAAGA